MNKRWVSIEQSEPPRNVLVIITGDSGYVTHCKFLTLAYIDDAYRPRHGGPPRWLNVQNNELTDYGWTPTHWRHIEDGDLP